MRPRGRGIPNDEAAHDRPPAPEDEAVASDSDVSGGAEGGAPPGALAEPPEEAVLRLERELDALQDRYLRLAAEYDNFRKRTGRERTELGWRAQAELIVRLIDALDDLTRFAQVDVASSDAKTLHEGIVLVERKLWKQLNTVGLVRIEATGVPFDPAVHEAVTTAAAEDPRQDNTVGMVLQPGYRLDAQLVRPARVLVLKWPQGDAG
jgi:molecular chaperone GrpE